jgi:hypothetical protein
MWFLTGTAVVVVVWSDNKNSWIVDSRPKISSTSIQIFSETAKRRHALHFFVQYNVVW